MISGGITYYQMPTTSQGLGRDILLPLHPSRYNVLDIPTPIEFITVEFHLL